MNRTLCVSSLAMSAAMMLGGTAIAQTIKIDGSSTVYPVTEAVAEEFQKSKKGIIKVTVGISGTGGGFKKFCRGDIDISNASRPILKKEMDACKETGIQYIELPVGAAVCSTTRAEVRRIERNAGWMIDCVFGRWFARATGRTPSSSRARPTPAPGPARRRAGQRTRVFVA